MAACSCNYISLGGYGNFGIDARGVRNGRFVVADGGNRGIGTAAPAYPLDVAGTILANGGGLLCSNAIVIQVTTTVDAGGCYFAP